MENTFEDIVSFEVFQDLGIFFESLFPSLEVCFMNKVF